jgi:hypothetical protein
MSDIRFFNSTWRRGVFAAFVGLVLSDSTALDHPQLSSDCLLRNGSDKRLAGR